jgi:antitoxin component YwqK of YwqJK toxin-antitoxin module
MKKLLLGLIFFVIFNLAGYAQRKPEIEGMNNSKITKKNTGSCSNISNLNQLNTVDNDNRMFIEYYPGGKQKVIGNYIDGKREGEWKEFYEDGTIKFEIGYFADKKNGNFIEYSRSGKQNKIGQYLNDLKEKKWIEYYDNLSIKNESFYCKGELDNFYIEYYPGGRQMLIGQYSNSQKIGLWIEFEETLQIKNKINYNELKNPQSMANSR